MPGQSSCSPFLQGIQACQRLPEKGFCMGGGVTEGGVTEGVAEMEVRAEESV